MVDSSLMTPDSTFDNLGDDSGDYVLQISVGTPVGFTGAAAPLSSAAPVPTLGFWALMLLIVSFPMAVLLTRKENSVA